MTQKEIILDIQHLQKSFGEHSVLKDVSFSLYKGSVISILGSSGSGKSTFLRCINLLEKPSGGQILYHGASILDPDFELGPYRAKVGMVFQQFNLFNNLSVLDNCVIGQHMYLNAAKKKHKTEPLWSWNTLGYKILFMQNQLLYRVVKNSALLLRVHLQWIPKSCSLMSLPAHLTPKWWIVYLLQ